MHTCRIKRRTPECWATPPCSRRPSVSYPSRRCTPAIPSEESPVPDPLSYPAPPLIDVVIIRDPAACVNFRRLRQAWKLRKPELYRADSSCAFSCSPVGSCRSPSFWADCLRCCLHLCPWHLPNNYEIQNKKVAFCRFSWYSVCGATNTTVGGSPGLGVILLAPNHLRGGVANEYYISGFALFLYVCYRAYHPGCPGYEIKRSNRPAFPSKQLLLFSALGEPSIGSTLCIFSITHG